MTPLYRNRGEPGQRNSEEILNVRLDDEADAYASQTQSENMYFNSLRQSGSAEDFMRKVPYQRTNNILKPMDRVWKVPDNEYAKKKKKSKWEGDQNLESRK